MRPATPGFLVTLAATVLLALVSLSVPLFRQVFFLKANLDLNGQNATVTFGVLGYCLDINGNVNCTSPRLGYEFDPNVLLDNKTPIKIPQVIIKWLTYALVLHIAALVCAAAAALFGLLSHIREVALTCCSSCISGFSGSIALIAFIFDVAFFFLVKARIDKVPGGSSQIGIGMWLTLAASILLFTSGCFYGIGRCCISDRPRGPRDKRISPPNTPGHNPGYIEAMRLDAVKAEADRKALQKREEIGLPAFQEYDPSKPLTGKYDEDDERYSDHPPGPQPGGYSNIRNGGYSPAPSGTSAMEAYYTAPTQAYPPPTQAYPPPTQAYPPPTQAYPPPSQAYPPPPMHDQYPSTQYNAFGSANVQPNPDQYLSPGTHGHGQHPSNESAYGHHAQNTSYYSAASHIQQPSYTPDSSSYNTGYVPSAGPATYPPPKAAASNYYSPPTEFLGSAAQLSMGRDDYTFTRTPPPGPIGSSSAPAPHPQDPVVPSNPLRQNSGPRGPRTQPSPTAVQSPPAQYDNPPGYEVVNNPSTGWPKEKQ